MTLRDQAQGGQADQAVLAADHPADVLDDALEQLGEGRLRMFLDGSHGFIFARPAVTRG